MLFDKSRDLSYVVVNSNVIKIGNRYIERIFEIESEGFFTTTFFIDKKSVLNILTKKSEEFEFTVNKEKYLNTKAFIYQEAISYKSHNYSILEVKLTSKDIDVTLFYQVYDEFPVIRKWIKILNKSDIPIIINKISWEKLNLLTSSKNNISVYEDYFSKEVKFTSISMRDCSILVHDKEKHMGLIVSTEAVGCLKKLEVYKNNDEIKVMLNDDNQTIFEKELEAKEEFTSPECFILLYNNPNFNDVIDNEYHNFLGENLIKVKSEKVPNAIWMSWGQDMRADIDRKLLLENINIAHEIGVDMVIVDSGWYDRMGDYNHNPEKFPNGLEEISDYIHSKGMKLSLWFAMTTVDNESKIYKKHPEWVALDDDRRPICMLYNHPVMCAASDFKNYIIDKFNSVIKRYKVDNVKIDIQALRNPYISKYQYGCTNTGHYHRNKEQSFWLINEAVLDICRKLRKENKKLSVNLTCETMGYQFGIDIGQFKSSDMNCCVVIEGNLTSLRREIFKKARVVLPDVMNSSFCMISDKNKVYSIATGALTIMQISGDLRKLTEDEKNIYKYWFGWIKKQREREDFYKYYKISDVFKIPDTLDFPNLNDFIKDGYYRANFTLSPDGDLDWRDCKNYLRNMSYEDALKLVKSSAHIDLSGVKDYFDETILRKRWDGVAKVNEQGEGPIFFFRPENSDTEVQNFKIKWVNENKMYSIFDVNLNKDLGNVYGKDLIEHGMDITIKEKPGTKVIEFKTINK